MNFFRKGEKAFISLEMQDLQQEAPILWNELNLVFKDFAPKTATLRFYECQDIGLQAVSVIAALAQKLKSTDSDLELEAPKQLISLIRKLNLGIYFSALTEV